MRISSAHHFATFSGFQIRVKDVLFYNFDFTWSSVTEVPQVIDWVEIRKDKSTSPHIRCYWLDDEKEEEVPALMADVLESSTAALLLVNTKNNFEIESKFLPPNQKCVFPVAVVTNSVGQTLKDVIDRYGNKVQARLEIESVTKAIQATEIKQAEELPQGSQGSVSQSALHNGYEFNFRQFAFTGLPQKAAQLLAKLGLKSSNLVMDLATSVQKILFPSDNEARIASENPELFVNVMGEFSTFENQVC